MRSASVIACLFSALLLASCEQPPSPHGPHLRKNPHIAYYLNAQANILTETVVRETFERWAEKTHFSVEFKGRNKAGLIRDGKNTVSFLLRWPAELPIGKVAYSKSWYDRAGDIVESDIIFNMQLTNFTTLRTNKPDSYYIEGVLAHEIGHMIGLDHARDASSIMKERSSAEESYFRGEIDALTLEQYRLLYGASAEGRGSG